MRIMVKSSRKEIDVVESEEEEEEGSNEQKWRWGQEGAAGG